jgi:hypothetical protein
MCNLIGELERCQADTLRILGDGPATRLANWRRYESDPAELVNFIQRVLHGKNRSNGWELDRQGGRSLERIVLDCGCPPFTEDNVRIAKETLGL